jgi:predicted DNA-binding transcriptional regulator AlpA
MENMQDAPYGEQPDAVKPEMQSGDAKVLLVSARRAAVMCGKSLRTWRTWDAAGWVPRPVRIGRSTLWRAAELESWVIAGCPRREEWEAQQ